MKNTCICCGRAFQYRHSNVGEVLLRAREARGISRTNLARRLGNNSQGIAAYESGISGMRVSTLQSIAEAMGYHMRIRLVPVDN